MKSILLIEDNDEIRDNTAEILELSNYRVFTASDGKQGVTLALEKKPDLVICDIMMPVLDGYGVLHMLHKNPATRNTPFIFLTAKHERTDVRKGMELGADDYITKPFTGTELLNAVEGRFKKIDALQESIKEGIDGMNELLYLGKGKEAVKNLAEGSTVNKYKKKQIIYTEGNRPSRLYYLKKGKVRAYKTNDEGKKLVVSLYNEGDFFGYVALLEDSNYKETTEVMEDCELAIISKEDFDELMSKNHEVASKFIKLLAKNVTDMEEQLVGLAYNSLRKKVVNALMTFYEKYNPKDDPGYKIEISRENLASIAGTATESLIRTLADFRDEKLIDIKNGNIIILNKNKLRNMIN
jgi:CRP-like cAMP-binding protein/CheY-like chemotaxis protein